MFFQDKEEKEIIKLDIDRGTSTTIPVLVQQSKLEDARRAVHFFFQGEDLSLIPNAQPCIKDQTCHQSKKFILHFLGHQSGQELHIYRLCGFSNHTEFESYMKTFCRCVYDNVMRQLQPECWDEWVKSEEVDFKLLRSGRCCSHGSVVEIQVRYAGFNGNISVRLCNKNEQNSLYIAVRPSSE